MSGHETHMMAMCSKCGITFFLQEKSSITYVTNYHTHLSYQIITHHYHTIISILANLA